MKSLKKLSVILIMLVLVTIPNVVKADEIEAEINQQTEYISEESKKAFNEFIQIKEEYKQFIILEVVLTLIALIAIWRTTAIEKSTKVFALIGLLALFSYTFRFFVDGTVIRFLDILLQILGVTIIIMANYYIYKHDNLLMYVPVYIVGMVYCFNYLVFVKDNPVCKMALIAAPIALFILGAIKQKTDEEIFMRPADAKHDVEKKK